MVWTGGGAGPFLGRPVLLLPAFATSVACRIPAAVVPSQVESRKGSGPIATSDGPLGSGRDADEALGCERLHRAQLRRSLVEPLAIGLLCSQLWRLEGHGVFHLKVDPGQA